MVKRYSKFAITALIEIYYTGSWLVAQNRTRARKVDRGVGNRKHMTWNDH